MVYVRVRLGLLAGCSDEELDNQSLLVFEWDSSTPSDTPNLGIHSFSVDFESETIIILQIVAIAETKTR